MKHKHVKAFATAIAKANGHDDPEAWAQGVADHYVEPEEDKPPSVEKDLKQTISEAKAARAADSKEG